MDLESAQESHDEHYSDVRTLLSWTAPGRPWRKKPREFYMSTILIFFLVEVIVFLFGQYQLMLAVGAITFLSIVLNMIPPKDFHYRISTEGVKIEDHFYIWGELYDFYFKKVETLANISKDHVRQVLINFLPYREYVKQTFMEKSADWLTHHFPLEKNA
jgi:hypothetical protein